MMSNIATDIIIITEIIVPMENKFNPYFLVSLKSLFFVRFIRKYRDKRYNGIDGLINEKKSGSK